MLCIVLEFASGGDILKKYKIARKKGPTLMRLKFGEYNITQGLK